MEPSLQIRSSAAFQDVHDVFGFSGLGAIEDISLEASKRLGLCIYIYDTCIHTYTCMDKDKTIDTNAEIQM